MTPEELVAIATFVLGVATFALAAFTYRMAHETRKVAEATEALATAAREQLRVARDEFAHMTAQAAQAVEPLVVLEKAGEVVAQEPERPGSPMSYLFVQVHLVNCGGPAIVEQLHVTGTPKVQTEPADVNGLIPSGGRLPFRLRFDVGNAAASTEAQASVPIRSRPLSSKEWRERLFFVTVRFSLAAGGWQADVRQPLNI